MDRLCYCTNVHAGPTLELARDNLERFACRTKSLLATSQNLGVGLWLPDQAAIEACQGETIDRFAEWLQAKGLDVFTMNGFSSGKFSSGGRQAQRLSADLVGRIAASIHSSTRSDPH